MASVIEGIEATPQSLQWLDSDSQPLESDEDILVGSATLDNGVVILPLEFQVLRVSHMGEYTCHVMVFLPEFEPLVSAASSYINVESMHPSIP